MTTRLFDRINRKWQPGDHFQYYGSVNTDLIVPGLFLYQGFNEGLYFSKSGKVIAIMGDAKRAAEKDNLPLIWMDAARYMPYVGHSDIEAYEKAVVQLKKEIEKNEICKCDSHKKE